MSPRHKFLSSLQPKLARCRKARREREAATAPAFTVFPYIRPDENRLSDILADLLRPAGPHGQGALFLKPFLKLVAPEWEPTPEELDQARVIREDPTSHLVSDRYIDFTIKVGGTVIGVENKPWAADQPGQLT